MNADEVLAEPRPRRLGPHYVPYIDCGRCGHEHHIVATTTVHQGRCEACDAFLRRPTEAEERQYHDFLDWNTRHMEADR